MSAQSIEQPYPIFADADGDPLENGYIWIGVENLYPITNPIAVYWDAALTQPAVQPIRTQGGYPVNAGTPARLYTAASYSILVQDRNGITVYSAQSETALTSSALVSFLQAGAGAVTRTAQSKMRDSVSVKDFGAVGDGAANDAPAFVLAIAAAAAAGGAVYVPGTTSFYRIADEITVLDGVGIHGDGWASRIRQQTAQKNAFIAGNNCSFDGLRISGDGIARNAVDFTKENGVYAAGKRNIKVSDCVIDGWQACGVQMANCFNYDISHNFLFGNYWSYPNGTATSADICAYSSASGARAVIIGNLCLSDNSQGILYNSQGFDSEATIAGNVCVTLNAAWGEVASGSLNRRHGIIASYGGGGGGRVTVTGNVCRNTLVAGIYIAMSAAGQTAVIVTGNVCSLNGFATVEDGTLAGGISVNGGQAGLVISNNAIHDFRGAVSNIVGAITYNDQNTDSNASAVIEGNSIDTSTAYGILLKGTARRVDVRGNSLRGCVNEDIAVNGLISVASVTGIRITGNRCVRPNATRPAIYVDSSTSTARIWIEDNHLTGFDNTSSALDNSGIHLRRGDIMSATVQRNKVDTFYYGISSEQGLSGRDLNRLQVHQNELANLNQGIAIRSSVASSLIPCVGNRFSSVTNKFDGAGFFVACVEASAILDDTRIHFESAASPTVRTFAVGDYAKNRVPVVGQPKGWYCTVAGTPGTWESEGNL
jgi:hypothetical protein